MAPLCCRLLLAVAAGVVAAADSDGTEAQVPSTSTSAGAAAEALQNSAVGADLPPKAAAVLDTMAELGAPPADILATPSMPSAATSVSLDIPGPPTIAYAAAGEAVDLAGPPAPAAVETADELHLAPPLENLPSPADARRMGAARTKLQRAIEEASASYHEHGIVRWKALQKAALAEELHPDDSRVGLQALRTKVFAEMNAEMKVHLLPGSKAKLKHLGKILDFAVSVLDRDSMEKGKIVFRSRVIEELKASLQDESIEHLQEAILAAEEAVNFLGFPIDEAGQRQQKTYWASLQAARAMLDRAFARQDAMGFLEQAAIGPSILLHRSAMRFAREQFSPAELMPYEQQLRDRETAFVSLKERLTAAMSPITTTDRAPTEVEFYALHHLLLEAKKANLQADDDEAFGQANVAMKEALKRLHEG